MSNILNAWTFVQDFWFFFNSFSFAWIVHCWPHRYLFHFTENQFRAYYFGFHRAKQSKLVMCCIWILSYQEIALIEMYILISQHFWKRQHSIHLRHTHSILYAFIRFLLFASFSLSLSFLLSFVLSSLVLFFTSLSFSLSIVFRNETCVIDRCWRWVIYRQQRTQRPLILNGAHYKLHWIRW